MLGEVEGFIDGSPDGFKDGADEGAVDGLLLGANEGSYSKYHRWFEPPWQLPTFTFVPTTQKRFIHFEQKNS